MARRPPQSIEACIDVSRLTPTLRRAVVAAYGLSKGCALAVVGR